MAMKIKPKDFRKRRNMSKTYKDWNDENGMSSSYAGNKKRKPTILDECESDFKKSPALNRNTRIDGSENIGELIYKISDGHIGASVALFRVYQEFDIKAISCIINLDALGFYGTKVYEMWETTENDPERFAEYVSDMLHGEL